MNDQENLSVEAILLDIRCLNHSDHLPVRIKLFTGALSSVFQPYFLFMLCGIGRRLRIRDEDLWYLLTAVQKKGKIEYRTKDCLKLLRRRGEGFQTVSSLESE